MAISSMVREFVFFGQHCGQFCFFSNGTAVTGRRAILLWHRPVLSESYEPRWLWMCIHVYTIRVHTVYEHLEVRRHSSRHLWCGQATPLLNRRAAILRQMYPTAEMLCIIYEASGFYKGAGLFKESYHFEWPHIHVTKEMAVSTKAQTIKIFEEKSGDCEHLLAKMLEKSRNLNLWNSWERIFDASTTNKGTGSRLPFCDKRSKLLDGQFIDEDRRVMPVVEVLFEFAGDECVRARPMAWRKDRTDAL